ncbi:hypothetical protein [Actinokineospora enzanensis]|uniref:hypothetical protein n=1 Tax=Actinokineospora enzanensis TaxID=155975 RepID=UPI00039FAA6A|nr:hypothetical protein [Actinokineospora enzanensis]
MPAHEITECGPAHDHHDPKAAPKTTHDDGRGPLTTAGVVRLQRSAGNRAATSLVTANAGDRGAAVIVQRARNIPVPQLNEPGEAGAQVWFAPWAWMTGHETALDLSDQPGEMDVAPGVRNGVISMGVSSGYWTAHGGGVAAGGGQAITFQVADDGRLSLSPPSGGLMFTLPQHRTTVDPPVVERSIAGDHDVATLRFGFRWHRDPDQVQTASGTTSGTETGGRTGTATTGTTATTVGGSTSEEVAAAGGKLGSQQSGSVTGTASQTSTSESSTASSSSTSQSRTVTSPGAASGDGFFTFSLVIRSRLRVPIRHMEEVYFAKDRAEVLDPAVVIRLAQGRFLPDQDDQIEFRSRIVDGVDEIILRGFASSQGRPGMEGYNERLSRRRCATVLGLLIGQGVRRAQVADIVSVGEDQAVLDHQIDNPAYQKVQIIVRTRAARRP